MENRVEVVHHQGPPNTMLTCCREHATGYNDLESALSPIQTPSRTYV